MTKPPSQSFLKYATVEPSNRGLVLELLLPDKKTKSGEWIRVRGVDSTAFQKANRQSRRELLTYIEQHGGEEATKTSDAYLDFTTEQRTRMQASLVMDWSFTEECTDANIIECFKQCPDIAIQVDTFAGKRELFVAP